MRPVNGLFCESRAEFSPCGRYRYTLVRSWDEDSPNGRIAWIMLNPSTATAEANDPTVARCMQMSRAWDHGSMVVLNLFALRSTDPRALARDADPVGPRNDDAIIRELAGSDSVMCAWGAGGGLLGRDGHVRQKLLVGVPALCLGLTKWGQPKHPLYVPGSTVPVVYDPSVAPVPSLKERPWSP